MKSFRREFIRFSLFSFAIGLALYSLGMIFVRLHMTQQAYQFRELKSQERSLIEEQQRLKVFIAESLAERKLLAEESFLAPPPEKVVRLP